MNPSNYASLEASKRLVEAGIVLETEFNWAESFKDKWNLVSWRSQDTIPAPSMAEVWRELPENIADSEDRYDLCVIKYDGKILASYTSGGGIIANDNCLFRNTNPTDVLIDLLIWLRRIK